MQNFPNSPVPLHPGFSRGGSVVSSSYQPHPSDLQISPRASEDYAAMQQAQPNLQSHGQHLHLRSQQHLIHTPIHGYGSRRGTGEMAQGNTHSGGAGNSYRKESMDYFLPVSGRERSRRGGAGFGAGFRYTNIDSHAPLQYQQSSGMISPYPMDYSSSSGSGVGGSNSSSGAGSFSPSQQYSMAHNTSVQSAVQMHQRQHSQKYPSHQGIHQGQHHQAYPLAGNRILPQFGHYAPINAASSSSRMYNSPPQRYDVSNSSTEAKINNSPTQSNPNPHSSSNNFENMGQSYSSSTHPPYSPQSQSLNKHAPHSQRVSQHSTGAGYDPSLKVHHHLHTKMPHSPIPSSPALPPDIAKSPMHSQNQAAHIQQNFSPISNSSPAPSAVQSPSCSSSSSPLMGNSEGNSTATHMQPSSHPSVPNNHNSQSHGRLLQAVPQRSPTPNSNSSISSCGSSVGAKTASLNHSTGIGHGVVNQSRIGLGPRGGPGEDGSLYPHDNLLQDPGLNSLNALTSQVENLPNTVQHMLLTDNVLSQKKSRDGAHYLQMQQSVPVNQNKCGNSTTVNEVSSEIEETKLDPELELKRIRQASGTSNESESHSYRSSHSQIQSELSQHGLAIKVNSGVISTASKQSTSESLTPFPQTKTPETVTPSSSSSPSVNPSAEPSPKQQLVSPPPPSPTHLAHLNCIAKRDLDNKDNNGMKVRKIKMIKDEESEVESGDPPCLGENRSENIFASTKEIQSAPPTKTEAETDEDGGNAQQLQNPSKNVNVLEQHNVGVIVSARSELHAESSKHTGAKSPRYGVSHYPNKHSCPEDQHDVKTLRALRNHNGEGEISMETYGSQYISPKQEFGQNLHLSHSNPSYTYSNPKLQYNACMSAKNKGKFETGSGMGPDRYQSYYQLQASYGSIARKDIGIFAVEGGRAIASRGQDSNSQFQQSFPSLLQEVLQGHHFDRRYGRPDQTSSVQQPQDTSQHRYQTRLPYSIIENLSSMGPQPVMGGLNVQLNQMASGKPPNSNKNQGPDNEMVLDPPHPTWDSEAQRPNLTQGISLEKSKSSTTLSQSTHMQQPSDLTIGAPPKHINLADYSLQHRKPSRYGTSPSAVEQLLLQETEPLACGVGPLSQTQSQTTSSSGRRSVICDVSPSRRTTPERERGHSGTSGPSVIQQPFSSSGSNEQEYCKGEIKAKKEHNEESTKINPAGKNADDYCSTPPRKEANKSLYPPVDVDSNLQRTSRAKGNNEPTSNLPYLSQMSSNPLSSPTRHQSYSQAVDGFRAYGFSDSTDGPKIMSHPLTHRPLPTISPYSKSTPSSNKLQAFSPSLPPQNRPNWTPDRHRLKDMDRHVPQSLPDQKCKSQSPSDILPSQHHISRQHSYPGSHFDMKMWDVFPEKEGAGKPHTEVPHENFGSQPALNSATIHKEEGISDRSAEESAKPFHSVAPAGAISAAGHTGKATQGIQQGQRQAKSGVSAETNPLIMRRRVRSFISPIPAKRKHQDVSSQRPGSAYHSPLSHSDSRLASNSCTGSNDTQPKLASPKPHHPISSSSSLPQCKTKILPPRKGCGLKLEAIVQKITPSLKKANFNINSHGDSDYTEVSHYTTDIADPEGGTSFSNVPQGEEGCLSYLEDSHTLDNIMPFRTVKDTYACDSQSLKPAATTSSSSAIRGLPKDFDFGLGAAGSSGSLVGENDKDDFTLLGPLPPPPPLPCPVQESPPPSLSALSDIQQFTNTYQQLETRRSEQSAANLLRQKLLETGMGFDDYTDYYGADTGHSQSPGHHLLSHATQHQMNRLAGSESKSSESIVPKGYFPSGKKKGRPVGSVNKQKRAQAQNQNAAASIPATPLSSPIAAPQSEPTPNTEDEVPRTPTPPDQKPCTYLVPPAQTQVVKVDVESEEAQPEIDVKPAGHRQRKVKEGNETSVSIRRQRRKRRGMASKEQLDTQTDSRVNMGLCGIFSDARNNVFSPYIHVEKKIAEIGAVCTIINAEDEKSKGGGKSGHCGVDAPLNTLSSQVVRREKENERTKENWVSEKVDSVSQSGKTLPTSGHVLPGPVITETGHTGCLLCCLCQKWANYKNLGDLYGPFYPAEYVAKLPKNQPQIRQTMSHHGAATTGFIMTSISTELTPQDTRLQDPQNVKSSTDSDCTVSQATNPTSPATTIGTASPSVAEEMLLQNIKTSCSTLKVTVDTWNPAVELASELGASKELDSEIVLKQLQVEELQQRPQHRKLTSHPRFKRRHKSSEDLPRTIPINNKASLPFQPPPPSLDSLGPMAQLAQLPLVPLDTEELWVHEGCIVWTSGVYLVNGRLYGLQEALDGARDTNCSHCEMVGSTLGCYSKGCTLRYHYLCAIEADCSLNEDNFSLRCPKHKSNRIAKPGTTYLEQSERGFSSRETTPDCVTFS